MFSYLPNSQRLWLIALLAIWALFLFGGFVFGPTEANRRMPTWTRMASSMTLVAAAWSWYLVARGYGLERYGLFIALGMTFGLVGDLWLAGLIPGGRNVIGGILAFGIGHVFYIVAMLGLSRMLGLTAVGPRWGALAVWWLIGAVGWYLMVYRGTAEPELVNWIALPYALLLASTAGLASGLALQNAQFVLLAVGAALFLLSDLILAAEMFSGMSFPLIGDVIWLTYGPGQMLIVYSVAAAIQLAGR